MRTVTIMTSEENNFNMIFIYENNSICGMNYKLMNRTITERDFVNNPELFQIYLDKAPVNNFRQYQVGCEAVLELFDRENIRTAIQDVADSMMQIMIEDERVGIEPNGMKLSGKEIEEIKQIELCIVRVMEKLYETRRCNLTQNSK